MHQLRWNAILQQWVVVSTHRQGRPQMPDNWCPFCPGSGSVPDHYDVFLYPNDFPAFSFDGPPFEAYTPGSWPVRHHRSTRRMRRGLVLARPQPGAFKTLRRKLE